MTPDARDLDRQLCAHARCVRGLAAALLGDPAAADDVAQEALIRAWQQPPRELGALRAFLLQITRNLARRWHRASARRLRREQAAAQPERQPEAGAGAARAEMLQVIAAEVGALPSLLREVVLLRHYDDLPPRRIAERLRVSVAAVESRLRRAHEQLAARLRARTGVRDLRAVLLPFAIPLRIAAEPLLGTLAMSTKSKSLLVAAAAALMFGGVGYLAFGGPPSPASPASTPGSAAGLPAERQAPAGAVADRRERLPVPAATTDRPPPEPEAWTVQLRGRVVDERRLPVAGAEVTAQTCGGGRTQGRTDAEGRFALALAADADGSVDPRTQGRICQGEVAAAHGERCGIVAFAVTAGTVEHAAGTIALLPAGGLRVAVRRGLAAEAGARVVARRALWSAGRRWEGTTRGDGAVELGRVPAGPACVAIGAADGTAAVRIVEVVPGRQVALDVDLQQCVALAVAVRSRADGAAIAGARLRASLHVRLEGGGVGDVALQELLPLQPTDGQGRTLLSGLSRDADLLVGAEHPDWVAAQPTRGADLSAPAPHLELLLDGLVAASWRLVADEVAVPADGVEFVIGHRPDAGKRVPLRDGRLTLDRVPPFAGLCFAWGPGCVAHLRWPKTDEPQPVEARLRRPRRLVVDLRDQAGVPLAGLPVRLIGGQSLGTVRTGADGRVVVDGLALAVAAGSGGSIVVASIESLIGEQELGRADLAQGDGLITAVLGPLRDVRARVFVDDRSQLPGLLQLCSPNGHVGEVEEDAARGLLAFRYWQHRQDQPAEVRLYGSWRQSIGVAVLPPGNGPADVEFKLYSHGAAAIDLVPPADGQCQLLVERAFGPDPSQFAIWTHVQPGQASGLPRLTNLRPGRFRLRDGLSDVHGPLVAVTADGPDATLSLDLAAVVELRGRVAAGSGEEVAGVAVEVRDGGGKVVRTAPVGADGAFALRVAADRSDLVLVAVRAGRASPPVPVVGPMQDVQLLLPR